jgi:ABC-type thiamin/hydroxymethylpyrimidine transport system permease subunit
MDIKFTGKEWYMSKTVWFNVITMVAGVIALMQGVVSDPQLISSLVLAQGLINVILRVWFTSAPIGEQVVKGEVVVK